MMPRISFAFTNIISLILFSVTLSTGFNIDYSRTLFSLWKYFVVARNFLGMEICRCLYDKLSKALMKPCLSVNQCGYRSSLSHLSSFVRCKKVDRSSITQDLLHRVSRAIVMASATLKIRMQIKSLRTALALWNFVAVSAPLGCFKSVHRASVNRSFIWCSIPIISSSTSILRAFLIRTSSSLVFRVIFLPMCPPSLVISTLPSRSASSWNISSTEHLDDRRLSHISKLAMITSPNSFTSFADIPYCFRVNLGYLSDSAVPT